MKVSKKNRQTRRQLLAKKQALAKQLVDKANSLTDPLKTLNNFHEYTPTEDCIIKLSCIKAINTSAQCLSWIFDIMERNMKHLYEQSQWGWNAVAKQNELTESTAWYLLASCNEKFVGFSHFRFDLDYGDEVLYCYELQLEPTIRRKGLGHFMMMALESMASQNQMQKVVLTVLKCNPSAIQFFHALGYKLDNTSPSASENGFYDVDYIILSKQNFRR